MDIFFAVAREGNILNFARDIRAKFLQIPGIVIVLSFCTVTRMVQFSDTPKWDALIYYNVLTQACRNFNFTFSQYWNDFSLAAHPTRGYASLLAIGEFLFTGEYVGIILVNLILSLLAAICMYRILEKVLPKTAWSYLTLGTCFIFPHRCFWEPFLTFSRMGDWPTFLSLFFIVFCSGKIY